MYNNKLINNKLAIEHIDKEIYFYNVHLFIKYVKNLIIVKSVNLIRENL